jgi:hypothetical protein
MKQFLIGVFLLCSTVLAHAQKTPETAMGTHGMAIFGGREGLYASHLPMFHAPHDTQVVFRFHLLNTANDTSLRTSLANNPTLWTLDPEPFDLLRLQPKHSQPLQQFSARIVEGHFERDGKEKFSKQTVIVDAVLYFHRLSPAEKKSTAARYHLIGKNQEWFLFKEIDRRPDFDLIMALSRDNTHPQTTCLSSSFPAIINIPHQELTIPAEDLIHNSLFKQTHGCSYFSTTLYFETEDLK